MLEEAKAIYLNPRFTQYVGQTKCDVKQCNIQYFVIASNFLCIIFMLYKLEILYDYLIFELKIIA